jgi:hypothetical protein
MYFRVCRDAASEQHFWRSPNLHFRGCIFGHFSAILQHVTSTRPEVSYRLDKQTGITTRMNQIRFTGGRDSSARWRSPRPRSWIRLWVPRAHLARVTGRRNTLPATALHKPKCFYTNCVNRSTTGLVQPRVRFTLFCGSYGPSAKF